METNIEKKFNECLDCVFELTQITPENEVCAVLWELKRRIDSMSDYYMQTMFEKQRRINMEVNDE